MDGSEAHKLRAFSVIDKSDNWRHVAVPFRGPPRYNPKRRSGLAIGLGLNWGWAGDRSSMASSLPIVPSELDTLSLLRRPVPSPCPSERPFSSASSSVSDGSHPSHEDNASIVTGIFNIYNNI